MAFTDFQLSYVNTYEEAYFWMKVAFPWMFVASFYIHLALLATEKFHILEKKIIYIFIYLPSAVFAILNLTTSELTLGVQMGYWGWTYLPSDSTLYLLAIIWAFLSGIMSAILILHYYLKSTGTKRQQAKYIFIGIYLPLIMGIVTEILIPSLFSIPSPSMLNLFLTIGLAAIVYGIWKFRLPQLTSSVISDKILSTMSNFLFLLDEEGKIIHVNLKAIELSGYSEEKLLGQTLNFIYH